MLDSQKQYNKLIHKTIEQTMLSQRANLLAYQMVNDVSDKKEIQKKLLGVVNQLRDNQKFLALSNFSPVFGFVVSDQIRAKYFEKTDGNTSVHIGITQYLTNLMNLAQEKNLSALTPSNINFQNAMAKGEKIADYSKTMLEFFEYLDRDAIYIMDRISNILLWLFWGSAGLIFWFIVLPKVREDQVLQETLNEKIYQMRKYRKDAEEGQRIKTQMVADVYHAFQTPMASAYAALSKFQGQHGDVATSLESLKFLQEHLAKLKQIAQIDSNHTVLDIQPVDLDAMLLNVKTTLGSRAVENQVALEFDMGHVPRGINGDRAFLYQILLTCCDFSIQASPQGRIKLTCHSDENDPTMYVFDLIAVGNGLTQNQLEIIFDPYAFQLKSKDYESSGGLSLVKKLVTLLQGKITVTSLVGTDLRMKIVMPKRPDPRVSYARG